MSAVARGFETLAVSELSAWHKFRREIFVKTDHTLYPPECLLKKTLLDLVVRPILIETLCAAKVNQRILVGGCCRKILGFRYQILLLEAIWGHNSLRYNESFRSLIR